MSGLHVAQYICETCGEKFRSIRMASAYRESDKKPRFCDYCRRKSTPWGKNCPADKRTPKRDIDGR